MEISYFKPKNCHGSHILYEMACADKLVKQTDDLSYCVLWYNHWYLCICPLPAISFCTNPTHSFKFVYFFLLTRCSFLAPSLQCHFVYELKEKQVSIMKIDSEVISLTQLHKAFRRGYRRRGSLYWKCDFHVLTVLKITSLLSK